MAKHTHHVDSSICCAPFTPHMRNKGGIHQCAVIVQRPVFELLPSCTCVGDSALFYTPENVSGVYNSIISRVGRPVVFQQKEVNKGRENVGLPPKGKVIDSIRYFFSSFQCLGLSSCLNAQPWASYKTLWIKVYNTTVIQT